MAIIITAIFTILSVATFCISYSYNKRKEFKQKACDLAKYYADNIMWKISFLMIVFKEEQLDTYFRECFDISKIYNFDKKELLSLVGGEENYENMRKKIFAVKASSIDKARILLGKGLGSNQNEQNQNPAVLNIEFFRLVDSLKNELEWFSMNFVHNLADNSIVYESLHQTFFSNVSLLYFFISKENTNSYDKFYINLITLFRKWEERVEKSKQMEKRINEEAEAAEEKLRIENEALTEQNKKDSEHVKAEREKKLEKALHKQKALK